MERRLTEERNRGNRTAIACLICGFCSLAFPLPWLITLYDYNVHNWLTDNFTWLLLASAIIFGCLLGIAGIALGVLSLISKKRTSQKYSDRNMSIVGIVLGFLSALGSLGQIFVVAGYTICHSSGIC
jgi:hypothetical protein